MAKRIYFFDDPEPVGRELLGGKVQDWQK